MANSLIGEPKPKTLVLNHQISKENCAGTSGQQVRGAVDSYLQPPAAVDNSPVGWAAKRKCGESLTVTKQYPGNLDSKLKAASLAELALWIPDGTIIDLSINSISGAIPLSVGGLTNLQEFMLSDNKISGSIPPSISVDLIFEGVVKPAVTSPHDPSLCSDKRRTAPSSLPLARSPRSQFANFSSLSPCIRKPQTESLQPISALAGANPVTPYSQASRTEISSPSPCSLIRTQQEERSPHPPSRLLSAVQNFHSLFIRKARRSGPSLLPDSQRTVRPSWRSISFLSNLPERRTTEASRLKKVLKFPIGVSLLKLHDDITRILKPLLLLRNVLRNQLKGSIPSSFGSLTSLQALDLSHNHLTGYIPLGLFLVQNLTKLLLLSNDISGAISPEIGQCRSLVRLRLDCNRIEGRIPLQIGGLARINFLDLSSN
ncbi:hypothetical protein M5K25_020364 [Dendrobium thyrsiflorum]|uniref:Uncharacterized protein n=1 Tax=Dendrobium thyrsiflorum TaxID=117978 RepID=A0ABD0U9W0_DENTH